MCSLILYNFFYYRLIAHKIIEEYYCQIKQDYGLEQLCLRNYTAIKNIGALVMPAISFCARLPKHIAIQQIAVSNLLLRKRLCTFPRVRFIKILATINRNPATRRETSI